MWKVAVLPWLGIQFTRMAASTGPCSGGCSQLRLQALHALAACPVLSYTFYICAARRNPAGHIIFLERHALTVLLEHAIFQNKERPSYHGSVLHSSLSLSLSLSLSVSLCLSLSVSLCLSLSLSVTIVIVSIHFYGNAQALLPAGLRPSHRPVPRLYDRYTLYPEVV